MIQLLKINKLGGIESLDFKGRGIDLRKFGRVAIERSTEILWNEQYQKWYIQFLNLGRFSGKVLDTGIAWLANCGQPCFVPQMRGVCVSDDLTLLFDEYQGAIFCEVLVIQSLRKQCLV